MPVKLKDVLGLMIPERRIPTIGYIGDMPEIVALPTGYNKARDLQGYKKIGLNRDKLSALLQECVHLGTCIYDKDCHEHWDFIDTIIANEHEILEGKDDINNLNANS